MHAFVHTKSIIFHALSYLCHTLSQEVHYSPNSSTLLSLRNQKRYKVPESPLLQIHWWRMISDEAQMVGSGLTQVGSCGNPDPDPDLDLDLDSGNQLEGPDPVFYKCSCTPTKLSVLITPVPGRGHGGPTICRAPLVRYRDAHRGGAARRRRGPAAHAEVCVKTCELGG